MRCGEHSQQHRGHCVDEQSLGGEWHCGAGAGQQIAETMRTSRIEKSTAAADEMSSSHSASGAADDEIREVTWSVLCWRRGSSKRIMLSSCVKTVIDRHNGGNSVRISKPCKVWVWH